MYCGSMLFVCVHRRARKLHIMIGGRCPNHPDGGAEYGKSANAAAGAVQRSSDLGKDIRGGWTKVPRHQTFYGGCAAF